MEANTEGTGSVMKVRVSRDGPAAAEPKGVQRLRFVGRWLIDSQSSDRLSVAHAILCACWLCK